MSHRLPPCDHDECPPSHCSLHGLFVEASTSQMVGWLTWLKNPNGAYRVTDRLTSEAVEGGGVLIKMRPYKA